MIEERLLSVIEPVAITERLPLCRDPADNSADLSIGGDGDLVCTRCL